jgi:hypothetical protein
MKVLLAFALAAVVAAIVAVPAQAGQAQGTTVIELQPGSPTFLPPTARCPEGRLLGSLSNLDGRRVGVLVSCVQNLEFECQQDDGSGNCIAFHQVVYTTLTLVLPGGLVVIDAEIDENGVLDFATGDFVFAQSYSGDIVRATGAFRGSEGTLGGGGTFTFHPDGSISVDAVMVITLT